MICRSVARRVAAFGLVLALPSAWLPVSEAGGRNGTSRISIQEDGGLFASFWSSLTALWEKNGCAIDPNGCAPGQLKPEKEPKSPKDQDAKDPKDPKDPKD